MLRPSICNSKEKNVHFTSMSWLYLAPFFSPWCILPAQVGDRRVMEGRGKCLVFHFQLFSLHESQLPGEITIHALTFIIDKFALKIFFIWFKTNGLKIQYHQQYSLLMDTIRHLSLHAVANKFTAASQARISLHLAFNFDRKCPYKTYCPFPFS